MGRAHGGNEVKGRIQSVNDLYAVYHQSGSINFRTMKQIPIHNSFEETCRKKCFLGGPIKDACKIALEETTKYFEENDDEQMPTEELVRKMSEHCSVKHMRQILNERYGQNIIVTSSNGKLDAVTFRYTARYILHEFFRESRKGEAEDKDAILKAAAKIVNQILNQLVYQNKHILSRLKLSAFNKILVFFQMNLGLFSKEFSMKKNIC
jgi:hypothetical protein